MITGNQCLPRDAGIPDIDALIYSPPGVPLDDADVQTLLRCYMREVLSRVDFWYLCRAGLLEKAVTNALPKGANLLVAVPQGIGLQLEIPRNGQATPYLDFFVIRIPVRGKRGPEGVAFAALEGVDAKFHTVFFRILTESEFLDAMKRHGFPPLKTLRLVHNALHLAATAETPDRVEPFASRIEQLGAKMAELFQARGLAW